MNDYRLQEIPPLLFADEQVKAKATELDELRRRVTDARRASNEARLAVDAAKAADRQALADALRTGGKDPGDKQMAKAQRELEHGSAGAGRARAGRRPSRRGAWRGGQWRARPPRVARGRRVSAARDRFGAAVDALAEAHGELQVAAATRAWLRGWPNDKYRPGTHATLVSTVASDGGPNSMVAVVEGLRALTGRQAAQAAAAAPAAPRPGGGSMRLAARQASDRGRQAARPRSRPASDDS